MLSKKEIIIVVTFDKKTQTSGGAFNRQLGEYLLTFEYNSDSNSSIVEMSDIETGSIWNIFTGKSISGPLKGKQLQAMEYNVSFWFAWVDWHPSSEIFLD